MKRFLIMFMILGLIAGSVAAADAEERFERAERTVEAGYYGAQLLYQYRSCAVSGGAGCVTLDTLPSEDSLTAKVTDAHGQPVSVWVVDAAERQIELDGPNLVYGTFCGQTTEPIRFEPGAQLELWVGGEWWPTWVVPEVPRCFPGAATTGTISVTLSGWTSSEEPRPVQSPTPQESPSGQTEVVERSVDLLLRGHLRGVGSVVAADELCSGGVPIVIQRKRFGAWRDIASTTTDGDGSYAVRLTHRSGSYRAVASEIATPETTCLEATSATVRHRH